jgi:hypothetical protein
LTRRARLWDDSSHGFYPAGKRLGVLVLAKERDAT